jgi:hypothetical protein
MTSMTASSAAAVAAGSLRQKRKADPAMALVFRKLRLCMLVLKVRKLRISVNLYSEGRK